MVFIDPKKQWTSDQGAYIWYFYTAVQRLLRTSRYYPEGIPKVAYVRYFGVCPMYDLQSVRFAECTFGGPPLYVRTTNNIVRSSDLAYD